MVNTMIVFFLIGCVLLLILIPVVYGSELMHNIRTVTGSISISAILMLIVSFFVIFQFCSYDRGSSFFEIIEGTALLMALLLLFDSLFIDLLLRGRIIPLILNFSNCMPVEMMKRHVIKTFTIGWCVIIPIIMISSLISYFVVL